VEKQACGPEARALREKSIGPVISDCGFRISDFFGFLLQSAIGIPQFGGGPIGQCKFGMRISEFGIKF
jgi:hypothetical protein